MSEQFLIPTYARQPVSFERGEGVWLYDADGNRFMDAVSGIAVCNLGHAHPAVTRTLADQAARVVHTSNLYRVPAQEELAARLCALSGMEKVFFSNSGAEANEAAIKLARLHGHQRGSDTPRILVMENSFHGRTLATLSATGNRKVQKGFEPLVEGFQHLPYNDLAAVEAAAADDQAGHIAAVLVEPVQGEGGIRPASKEFMQHVKALCDEHKLVLMFDEVQCGVGRTGKLFAHQHYGITPDVMALAKGLGGGFPIGACVTTAAVGDAMVVGSHGSTFGGNPLAMAVGNGVMDLLLEPSLLDEVVDKGQHLQRRLHELVEKFPDQLASVHGKGLMVGVKCHAKNSELADRLRANKLLVGTAGGNMLRLLPPLNVSNEHLDQGVDVLEQTLAAT